MRNSVYARAGSIRTIAHLIGAGCLSLLVAPPLEAEPNTSRHFADTRLIEALRGDAELQDVHFADARHGWAVGSHGTIWHTDDGGRKWQLQPSGVHCSLNSVFFLDTNTGWAAGGFTHPHSHVTTGILLRTHDGGQNWVRWKRGPLPLLLKIKFLDMKQGWAIAQPCSLYPHGVLFTDDGGRTWTPTPLAGARSWLCGDFLSPLGGALAGRNGALGTIDNRNVTESKTPHYGLRTLRDLALESDGAGYSVGDGGLVIATRDAGIHWTDVGKNLPDGTARNFDFRAVAANAGHVWIAGAPGNRIFYSSDRGQNWTAHVTPQSLPVKALDFVDDQHGWAVGAMGTMMATTDGGKNWQLQRTGPRRAAVLAIFASADQVPLELLSRLSAGEGYLSAVSLIGRRDLDSPARATDMPARRSREALQDAGAGAVEFGWSFPLHQNGLQLPTAQILRRWTAINRRPAGELLGSYVERQIRMWRPDLVVTVAGGPRNGDPIAQLLNQTVLQAVNRAALPTAGDGRQRDGDGSNLELGAWQVSKVYGTLPSRTAGTVSMTTSQVIPSLGRSLSDYAARPRGLLHEDFAAAPAVLRFQLLLDQLPQGQGQRDFFSGLTIQHGSEARRQHVPAQDVDIRALKRAATRRQVIRAIVASAGRGQNTTAARLGQIHHVVAELDDQTAGDVLYELANRCHQEGHWTLAAETFELLAERYAGHELAAPSLRWLIQFHASGEANHRFGNQPLANIRQVGAALPATPFDNVSAPESAQNAARPRQPMERATLFAGRLQKADLMLHADPMVQMPLAAALRKLGDTRAAERAYLGMQRSSGRNAWWYCAESERLLIQNATATNTAVAKPFWICRRTEEKPLLDGRLDEAIWKQQAGAADAQATSGQIHLRSILGSDQKWPASVLVSYDNDYLYFGIQCHKADGIEYPVDSDPRTRDAELDNSDRVDLMIDIDRDYATYYRLSIDSSGRTRDSCWKDTSWNPDWYVATRDEDDYWVCEAAIPLKHLISAAQGDRRTWAVGVQRTVPGIGFQSWTQPASTQIAPEGFGYLQFE